MKHLLAVALLIPLAACSGPSAAPLSAGSPSAPPAVSSARSPSPTVAGLSLKKSCDNAAHAFGGLGTFAEYQAAIEGIQAVVDAGDRESKDAFSTLVLALKAGQAAKPGDETLNASGFLIDTLDSLQKRCAAVGSSAFS